MVHKLFYTDMAVTAVGINVRLALALLRSIVGGLSGFLAVDMTEISAQGGDHIWCTRSFRYNLVARRYIDRRLKFDMSSIYVVTTYASQEEILRRIAVALL